MSLSASGSGSDLGWPHVAQFAHRHVLALTMGLLALRVVFWFSPGYTPDNANSYVPLVPFLGPPASLEGLWSSGLDNGFPNVRLPEVVVAAPQTAVLGLAGSSYAGEIVWLWLLYAGGGVLAALALRELLPPLRMHQGLVVLAGCAYQLAPGLMYGLQDTSAFGLPLGLYWGIPLFVLAGLWLAQLRHWWSGPLFGVATLLLATEFPASVVVLVVLGSMLALVVLLRAHAEGWVRRIPWGFGSALGWSALANAWWLIPELLLSHDYGGNLAVEAPVSGILPDHFARTLLFDWAYPSVPPALPYLATVEAQVALTAIALITYASLISLARMTGGLVLYASFLALLVGIYSYALPTGPYFLSFVSSSPYLYLLRNPVRLEMMFDFLFAGMFPVGVGLLVPVLRRAWGRLTREKALPSVGRVRYARFLRGVRPSRAWTAAATLALGGLIVSSWPLVIGSASVDTYYTGSQVLPYEPPQNGVKVPEFYYQARDWLAAHVSSPASIVLPEPGTWVSGQSRLGWKYEGTSTLYTSIFPGRLVMNVAGTLTRPAFPAEDALYAMAAAGGPPAAGQSFTMNGTDYVWSGYVGDSIVQEGRNATAELNWTIANREDFGTNGHQFSTDIAGLPAGAAYLSFNASVRGDGGALWVTWGIGNDEVGWYPLTIPNGTGPTNVVVSLRSPPAYNYDPSVLRLASFPNATYLTFRFLPDRPGSGGSTQVLLSNFRAADSAPSSMLLYFRSMGLNTIIVDQSMLAGPKDPQQNLSTFAPFLGSIQTLEEARFGNVSFYRIPNPDPLWGFAENASSATSYWTADAAGRNSVDFVLNTSGLSLSPASDCQLSNVVASPWGYTLQAEVHGRCLLDFLQNFDPNWQIVLSSGATLEHLMVNGFANGWVVEANGDITIRVQLTGQAELEGAIVLTPIVASVAVLLTAPGGRTWVLSAWKRFTRTRRSKGG